MSNPFLTSLFPAIEQSKGSCYVGNDLATFSQDDPRDYALALVENGTVDEHTLLVAALKFMSHDDVRQMLDANELSPRFANEIPSLVGRITVESVTPVLDDPDSDRPTSYVVRARVEIDGTPHETVWVGIEQPDGKLSNTGWEASDQWVDPTLALKLDHEFVVKLGEAVLARAVLP